MNRASLPGTLLLPSKRPSPQQVGREAARLPNNLGEDKTAGPRLEEYVPTQPVEWPPWLLSASRLLEPDYGTRARAQRSFRGETRPDTKEEWSVCSHRLHARGLLLPAGHRPSRRSCCVAGIARPRWRASRELGRGGHFRSVSWSCRAISSSASLTRERNKRRASCKSIGFVGGSLLLSWCRWK